MKYSFVTFLGTDSFLPGVIALSASIKKHHSTFRLVIMISESVSENTIQVIDSFGLEYKIIKAIANPNEIENDDRGFRHMYTKLRMFELYEFDKLVYIDADMLVSDNIDMLFEKPHMSAVIAGALHAGCKSSAESGPIGC